MCGGNCKSSSCLLKLRYSHTYLGRLHQAQNAEIARLKQEVQEGVVQQLMLEARLAEMGELVYRCLGDFRSLQQKMQRLEGREGRAA